MVLLIGTNPRWESPVFNARLRKVFLDGTAIGLVGEPVDLTYKYEHVGSDPAALAALAGGQHPWLERLKKAARPAVVVGPGVLRRADREAVMRAVHDLCAKAGGSTRAKHALAHNVSLYALCGSNLVSGWVSEIGGALLCTPGDAMPDNREAQNQWTLRLSPSPVSTSLSLSLSCISTSWRSIPRPPPQA